MARRCKISGKIRQIGNLVSHANNKTSRAFGVNLQSKRIYVPELKRFVRMKVSTDILRTIDKCGFANTLKMYNLTLADL